MRIASVLPSRSMFRGTWILDPRSMILDPRSMFRDLGSKIQSTSLDNLFKILSQDPIFLAQSLIFFNGFLISEKSKKIFFNGFPISSTTFQFLQWFSAFWNGFPISSTAFQFSSTAFHFLRNMGKSIYGGKYTKDRYPSFVFSAQNHDIPR